MPYVSLLVEFLRARPLAVFWAAALTQAVLWVLVPVLFYSSPPGGLPELLVIGREWQLGSWSGPPLAFWLADFAFSLAGGRPLGVYLLAQICVLGAFWAVFTLARSLVGIHHAALAALLMTGVFAFSVPTPEFGPGVLALPLAALTLLHYWRALGEGRRNAWIDFAFALGLLLLTSYWGFLLLAVLVAITAASRRGRAALTSIDPWAATAVALLLPFPHFAWLWQQGGAPLQLAEAAALGDVLGRLPWWPVLTASVLAFHAGLIVLVLLAAGFGIDGRGRGQVPIIERTPIGTFGRGFVMAVALALPLLGTLAMVLLGRPLTANAVAPLVLLSALAVVVAAGDRIAIHRQHQVGSAWLAMLLAPVLATVAAMAIVPWTGAFELSSQQPAAAMGRFFSEAFQRRTGQRLPIVVGDSRAAYLVAVSSPDRPSIVSAAAPERTPWRSGAEVRRLGAVVIWPLEDATGQPPAAIRNRYPELVAEVPQSFPRPIDGLLPHYRVGWGLIRPQAAAAQ